MEVSGRLADKPTKPSQLECDPCKSTGETQTADHFCTDCQDFLCSSCTKAHRKLRYTKDHNLLGQDEIPREKPSFTVEINCKKHEDKPFDYFCKDHDELCCNVCLNLDHIECSIEYIKELADRLEQSEEVKRLMKKLKDLDELVLKTKTRAERNTKGAERISNNIVEEVKRFRTEMNDLLDSLERKVLDQARKIKDEDIQTMSHVTSELDAIQAELAKSYKSLETCTQLKQNKRLAIVAKIVGTETLEAERKIDELSDRNQIREVQFYPNENISRFLRELEEFGSFGIKKQSDREKVSLTKPSTGGKHVTKPLSITHNRDIDIKHKQDKDVCYILGSVMIDSHRLALADYNNNSVKVVDLKQNIVSSSVQLESGPRDITYTERKQLVVTAPKIRSIIFIDVRDTLTINKTIRVGELYWGISSIEDKLIVGCMSSWPRSVRIINMEGQVIKSITTDSKGENLFLYPWIITTSPDKKAVYVSDFDKHMITKLDGKCSVLETYNDSKLRRPRGLVVDKHNDVFVVGQDTNNICTIRSGQIQSVLQVDNPRSVAYCEDSEQIVISRDQNNKISVYNLYKA